MISWGHILHGYIIAWNLTILPLNHRGIGLNLNSNPQ